MPYISSLHVYPIKSCAGHELSLAHLDTRGIHQDRSWVVVNAACELVTQRDQPTLSLVQPALKENGLLLSAPEMENIFISREEVGDVKDLDVWGAPCKGIDQGDDAADWFSAYLGMRCRLLYFKPGFVRPVDPDYASSSNDQVGFADSFPLMMISEASLADLNVRLAEPIRMNRFRPNIVVADCPPYAEDTWRLIRIGDLELDLVKPCGRCSTTLVDQESSALSKEPLKTLSTYRIFSGPSPIFGQNLVHRSQGVLESGMVITIIELRDTVDLSGSHA